eukprot:UN32373
MPLGFLPPVLASSCRWLPSLSSSSSPWWRKGGGAGSGEIPLNKLAGLSDLQLKLLLPHFSSSCHGGGLEEEEERGFWLLYPLCVSLEPKFCSKWLGILVQRAPGGSCHCAVDLLV